MAGISIKTYLITIAAGMLFLSSCAKKDSDELSALDDYSEQRISKDQFFKNDPNSPLLEKDRPGFIRLKYYDPDSDYKFTGQIQKYEEQEIVEMLTSTSELQKFYKYGYFTFNIDGNDHSLQLYKAVDASGHDPYYFIPFKDLTNGSGTYPAGRYLDIPVTENDIITVDFNAAYNPYCAYSPYYSCPLPPMENHLKVRISTGEKDYKTGV